MSRALLCGVALAAAKAPPARDYRYCGRGCTYAASVDWVVLHVPKTGGLTAREALKNCTGVFVEYANHVLTALRILRLGKNVSVTLRAPEDRVVSEWHWLRAAYEWTAPSTRVEGGRRLPRRASRASRHAGPTTSSATKARA